MSKLWKIALAAVAALTLGVAAGSFVLAQDEDGGVPGTGPLTNFMSRLAANLGITEEELEAAVDETQLEIVDEMLADGTITEEEAAELRERIESGEGPVFGPWFHHRAHKLGALHGAGEELAEFLGITVDELREARADEQSLAQIAEANDVGRQELIDFLVGQVSDGLAEKVEEGKLDQERADEMLARFEERVDDLIDRTEPFRPRWHKRFDGPFAPDVAPEEGDAEVDPASTLF